MLLTTTKTLTIKQIKKMETIIKGAYYRIDNQILIPHETGSYNAVDCTRYIPLEELKNTYDKKYIKENINDFVEVEGAKYYYAECEPRWTAGWELLSDISDIHHVEEKFDF